MISVFSGRVAYIGLLPGYGRTVIINHGDHYYTIYAQLEGVLVKEGQRVKRDQVIGGVEDPGLYFEVRHFSDAIDPLPWLQKSPKVASLETGEHR